MNAIRISEEPLESLITTYQSSKCNLCFGEIYNRHFPKILSYCRRLTRNNDDAYDITMDCFLKAWEKIHTLKDATYFTTWLFKIAHNLCMDRGRKIKREKTFYIDENFDLMDDTTEQEMQKERESTIKQLKVLLDNIEPKNKEILIEKYIYNKTLNEIKTEMGITESAVKMRLSRARKKVLSMAS